MQEINFVKTTMENYKKHSPANSNLYFITNSADKAIYLGSEKISSAFVDINDGQSLPVEGSEGVFYIDKRNGSFKMLVWNKDAQEYYEMPLADQSYLKTVRRGEDDIIGVRGNGEEVSAKLDGALTTADIDTLFPVDDD